MLLFWLWTLLAPNVPHVVEGKRIDRPSVSSSTCTSGPVPFGCEGTIERAFFHALWTLDPRGGIDSAWNRIWILEWDHPSVGEPDRHRPDRAYEFRTSFPIDLRTIGTRVTKTGRNVFLKTVDPVSGAQEIEHWRSMPPSREASGYRFRQRTVYRDPGLGKIHDLEADAEARFLMILHGKESVALSRLDVETGELHIVCDSAMNPDLELWYPRIGLYEDPRGALVWRVYGLRATETSIDSRCLLFPAREDGRVFTEWSVFDLERASGWEAFADLGLCTVYERNRRRELEGKLP